MVWSPLFNCVLKCNAWSDRLLGFLFDAHRCITLLRCQHHTTVSLYQRSPSVVFILQKLGSLYVGVPALNGRWREILGCRVGAQNHIWAASQKDCPSRANLTLLKLHTLILRHRQWLVFLSPLSVDSCQGPTASKRGWVLKPVSVCSSPTMMQMFVCPNGLWRTPATEPFPREISVLGFCFGPVRPRGLVRRSWCSPASQPVASPFRGVYPHSCDAPWSRAGLFPVSAACSKLPYTQQKIIDLNLSERVFQMGEWDFSLAGAFVSCSFTYQNNGTLCSQ